MEAASAEELFEHSTKLEVGGALIASHVRLVHGQAGGLTGAWRVGSDGRTIGSCCPTQQLLDRLLLRLKEAGHRALIFCQLLPTLRMLVQYCMLRGEVTTDQLVALPTCGGCADRAV